MHWKMLVFGPAATEKKATMFVPDRTLENHLHVCLYICFTSMIPLRYCILLPPPNLFFFPSSISCYQTIQFAIRSSARNTSAVLFFTYVEASETMSSTFKTKAGRIGDLSVRGKEAYGNREIKHRKLVPDQFNPIQ